MAWTARIILGLAAALAAGSAMACERQAPCGRYDAPDRYGPPAHHHDAWRDDAYQHDVYQHDVYRHDVYRHDAYREPYGWREAPPPCRSACGGGEITLPASFFAGAGGVGPIPSGPIYGGYYYVVRGRGFSGAHAFAASSASASVSTRVSVGVSGGGRSGGCCH